MTKSTVMQTSGLSRPWFRLFDIATNSLAKKIIWLTCVSVFIATAIVSTIGYFQLEKVVLKSATEKLAGETRLMAERFKIPYDHMAGDTEILSLTPPVQGIIRSTLNGGTDPLDGSSIELWRDRLATIFSSLMSVRPDYFQIRLIGIADQGREIVRINRLAFGVEAVPVEQLQQKATEAYFEKTVKTQGDDVLFSDVTYNREMGSTDADLVPTIRTMMPVYDQYGQLFGMLVINSNYSEMLLNTFKDISPREEAIVFNSSGDYIKYSPDETAGFFELHSNYKYKPPRILYSALSSSLSEQLIITDDEVAYFVRILVNPGDMGSFLGAIIHIPKSELLAPVYAARDFSIVYFIILVALCLVFSFVLVRKFTKPMRAMVDEINMTATNDRLPDLPLTRNDEFGELARAFDMKTRALAISEEKIRSILDNVVDGIITIDERGIIDSYNPACERIFGYPAEDAIGKNVTILMPDEYVDTHRTQLARYVATGEAHVIGQTAELSAVRRDGSVFPMEISISELTSNNRRLFSGIIRDISERKQIEILKDEFISTVNHEIRTPLTAIQGSLGLLKHRTGANLDDKAARLLNLSYENCENLAHLINDILDIEKMVAGKMEYDIEEADLGSVVAQSIEQQFAYAEKYGVKFVLHSNPETIFVRIDRNRFNQALVNLLSNAAKFSPKGARIEIMMSMRDKGHVRISVRDYGPGIPEDFQGKIFEKFAQADSSATRAKGGSGLGLSITKTIIEALDGSVEFETEPGSGTTFTLVLPVCTATSGDETAETNNALAVA